MAGQNELGAPGPAVDELVSSLVERFSTQLYRQSVSIMRDPALAEDVVQETLVRAWLSYDSFRGEGSLAGWVMRIGHNVAVSALRRQREVLVEPDFLAEEETRGFEKSVVNQMAVEEVWRALEDIDPLSRTIIILRDVEGFSYQEIADITDATMATVKTRLFRTRRELADRLKDWR